MKSKNKKSYKTWGWTGLAACGLCCVLPIIGAVASIGALTTLSYYLESIGIVALGIAGILFAFHYYQKRKSQKDCAASCETNCDCNPKQLPIENERP